MVLLAGISSRNFTILTICHIKVCMMGVRQRFHMFTNVSKGDVVFKIINFPLTINVMLSFNLRFIL